jgi:hypothetical protein
MLENKELKLSKKDQQFVEKLFSSDDEVIIKSLKKIKEDGNENLIPALLHVYSTTSSEDIKSEINSILSQLKNTNAIEILIALLATNKYPTLADSILSAIWQTGYDASKHLNFFIEIAINGEYMTCLDVLSIIENMKGPFEDEHIMSHVEQIESHILEQDIKKSTLLTDLVDAVRNL